MEDMILLLDSDTISIFYDCKNNHKTVKKIKIPE